MSSANRSPAQEVAAAWFDLLKRNLLLYLESIRCPSCGIPHRPDEPCATLPLPMEEEPATEGKD